MSKPARELKPRSIANQVSPDLTQAYLWLFEDLKPDGWGVIKPSDIDGGVLADRKVIDQTIPEDTRRAAINRLTAGSTTMRMAFICRASDESPRGGNPILSDIVTIRQLDIAQKTKLKSIGLLSSTFGRVNEVAITEIAKHGQMRTRKGWARFDPDDHYWSPTFGQPDRKFAAHLSLLNVFGVCFWAAQDRLWWVKFKQGDNPGVRFLTDPIGIKEWFRMRDVPPGKDRRDALSHWVNEHWRKRRDDPEAEVHVRGHLRGTNQFQWMGMDVEINVPPVLNP